MSTVMAKISQHAPQSTQLARYLVAEIQAGRLRPGAKLPSVRHLAERYAVGRQVVLSALTILCKQNLAYSAARRGFFVNPDLHGGYFQRLGLFVNLTNPARSAQLITALYYAALRQGWQLILGSNFESSLTLTEWLAGKDDLDGIMVTGYIDDPFLQPLLRQPLPYLVVGNYDIAPRHPQLSHLHDRLHEVLPPCLKDCHSAAAIIGPASHRDEQLLHQRLECLAAKQLPPLPLRILHAEGDGSLELERLRRDGFPDLLFFAGEHAIAWRRLLHRLPPSQKRPAVIISTPWNHVLETSEFDQAVDWRDPDFSGRVIARILELIHARQNPGRATPQPEPA